MWKKLKFGIIKAIVFPILISMFFTIFLCVKTLDKLVQCVDKSV